MSAHCQGRICSAKSNVVTPPLALWVLRGFWPNKNDSPSPEENVLDSFSHRPKLFFSAPQDEYKFRQGGNFQSHSFNFLQSELRFGATATRNASLLLGLSGFWDESPAQPNMASVQYRCTTVCSHKFTTCHADFLGTQASKRALNRNKSSYSMPMMKLIPIKSPT